MAYGATDDFGFKAVEKPVHVHDLHATMLHLMGLDHTRLTYRYSGRDFRLTDVAGNGGEGHHRVVDLTGDATPGMASRLSECYILVDRCLVLTMRRRMRLFGLAILVSANLWSQPAGECGIDLQGNAMFAKGTVGDSGPLNLVLDSGSIRTSLDETLARSLGYDLSRKAQSSGGNGRQTLSVLTDVPVTLCGKTVVDPVVVVYPLEFLTKAIKRQVDGIVGIEIFRKYVVVLDYPKQRLEIIPSDGFTYQGSGTSIPVTYGERLPIVAGYVTPFGGEPIPIQLMVDSGGSAVNVDFYHPFEEKSRLAPVCATPGTHTRRCSPATGRSKRGRVQALSIGGVRLEEPEVQILGEAKEGGFPGWDGTLGSGFLKQFRVIFDLPHDRIVLERP